MEPNNIKSGVEEDSLPESIDQSWTLKEIVTKRVPITWEKVFADAEPELDDINEILREEEERKVTYYPFKKDLFRAFHLTTLQTVKVVLIGQDPYPNVLTGGRPQAVGMSFSVPPDAPIPSSLQNIYKELKRSIEGFQIPSHGDLTGWAQQGVLLLNMCLTVRARQPESHGDIWLGFVNKVINHVCEVNPKVVFILLGAKAQKARKFIGERVSVVEGPHPSGKNIRFPFIGNDVFLKTNELLVKTRQIPVNWNLDTPNEQESIDEN